MAKQARYTIGVPIHDNLGNKLKDIATEVHHMIHDRGISQGSYITGPHRSNWEKDAQELIEHVVTVANDTPENDSHIKEIAAHVGQVCNQWGVFVMKEGSQGIQSWVINNPSYQEGHPAPATVPVESPSPAGHYGGLGAFT